MTNFDGHFTIINEPGTANDLAKELLNALESVKEPASIVITEKIIESAASRALAVLISSLDQSVMKLEDEISKMNISEELITHKNVDKAHSSVLDATYGAEKSSSSKNWKKLDKARKRLDKELAKVGFETYTQYVDFLNDQKQDSRRRRELIVSKEDIIAKKTQIENSRHPIACLSSAQIITVLADVLSRAPHAPMGPLPIVFDDALRNVEAATKLRAMEILKAHSSHYATWYVTDDPVVLGWAGFVGEINLESAHLYDVELDA